jgi:DnaJ-class molecular chaperone
VPSSASQQEIKSAYKRLVHSLHPDKHQQAQVSYPIGTFWHCCSAQLDPIQHIAATLFDPKQWRAVQVDTTEAFLRCKAAYEVLSNEQSRSEYDQQLDAAANTWQVGQGAGACCCS